MSVRTSVARASLSLRTMCSAIAPRAPVIKIVLPERSMLIMFSPPIGSRKYLVPRFGDENVVFNSRARAPLANIYTRLNRDYHAGLEFGAFVRNDSKSWIVIAEANMMPGEVSKEVREPAAGDAVPCHGINVVSGNAGAYFIDCSFLRVGSNIQYFFNLELQMSYRRCAGQVAPIAINTSSQLNQDQVAVLQAPPGGAVKSSRIRRVGTGLHHRPGSGMKNAIVADLALDG